MRGNVKRGSTIWPRAVGSVDAVQRTLFLLVIVGLPLFFVRFTSDPFNLPKLALLLVLTSALWAVVTLDWSRGNVILHFRYVPLVPMAAVVLPLVISWLFNSNRWWGLLGAFGRYQGLVPYLVTVSLTALVVTIFFKDPSSPLRALGLSGAILGGYACFQWIGLDPFTWAVGGAASAQITAGLGNSNFVGGFLAMTLPAGIAVSWQEPRGGHFAAVGLVVLGLLATRSQGAWVAAVAGAAPVVLFCWGDRFGEPARRFFVAAFVVAAAGAVAVGAVIYSASAPRGATFTSPTARYRADWWGTAIEMGIDRPVRGYGPNAFAVESIPFRSQQDAVERPFDFTDDPHSVPLSWLANWGVLGLVGYVVLVGWIFIRGFEGFVAGSWVAATYFAVLVAYLVQGLLSIDELSLRTSAWIAVGGLAIAVRSDHERGRKRTKGRKKREGRQATNGRRDRQRLVPFALVTCACVASVFIAGRLVVADTRAADASSSFARGNLEGFVRSSRGALDLWDTPHYRHMFGFRLGMAVAEGDVPETMLTDVRKLFSFLDDLPDVPALRDFGRVLFLAAGLPDVDGPTLLAESASVYQRAHALDSQNPLLRAELAEVLVALGRAEEALRLLAPYSDEVGYTNAPFWAALALAFDANGLEEESVSALVQAHRLDEEDLLVRRVTAKLQQATQ